MSQFLTGLEGSGWFKHIRSILLTSLHIVKVYVLYLRLVYYISSLPAVFIGPYLVFLLTEEAGPYQVTLLCIHILIRPSLNL